MENLPQEFLDRIRTQLGEAFDAFLACFDAVGYAGIRVNTGKVKIADFLKAAPFPLERVPWTHNGFYYAKGQPVTKHPYYYAGLYYVQEPSAMLPAANLSVQPGDVVLDLCAAPGGKATELSSCLRGQGLLIANDASASRAKALVKNLSVWGSSNCCITAETPEKLLENFGCCFDKALVDAPCSGEGMFRKDQSLIAAWKEKRPGTYAKAQLKILHCAVQMVKPGGLIAYSTCTFAKEEDEEVIAAILQQHSELELVKPKMAQGFDVGSTPCERSVRLWPHRVKGEGHFLALLRKRDCGHCAAEQKVLKVKKADIMQSHRQISAEVMAFLSLIPKALWENHVYGELGEQCFLLPPYRLPKRVRYLRTGILLGTQKRGRFEPSQSLAMLLKKEDFPRVLDLSADDQRTIRYLKGETLELTDEEREPLEAERRRMNLQTERSQKAGKRTDVSSKDWILICVDGFGLGWGKYANGSIKNKYYPGWRLQ